MVLFLPIIHFACHFAGFFSGDYFILQSLQAGSSVVQSFFLPLQSLIVSINPWLTAFLFSLGLVVAVFLFRQVWVYMLNKAVDKKMALFFPDHYAVHRQEVEKTGVVSSAIEAGNIDKVIKETENFSEEIAPVDYDTNFKLETTRYRDFAQLLPDIVFECDTEGNILFLNDAAEEKLGLEAGDYKEKKINIFSFIDPRDKEKAGKNFQNVSKSLKSDSEEYRILDHKNMEIHVLSYSIPVIWNKKVTGIRGLFVDISRRKKNEETIRILQDTVSHVGIGISVFRMTSHPGRVGFQLEVVNEAARSIMRFFTKENTGKDIKEVSPVFVEEQLHEIFEKVIRTGVYEEIESFNYTSDPEVEPFILNVKVFPIPQNRVALIVEDATEKKKAEQNLKMTSFGIENAGDIIIWLDEKARFLFANTTATKKYGYSNEELLNMGFTDIDARINMTQWYELMQILETKGVLTVESINRTRRDDTFPVEVSINKFLFDGKKYYLAFIRDISDRKRNDELEQKIQIAKKSAALKQQFLANMSHEIRTPMTGIMGMTSLLMRTSLNPAQQEYVRNIKISSENLLNIINDVLDLSKIEAGKMELKPVKVVFRDVVAELKEIFQHQAQSKGLQFGTSVDPLIPSHVIVDEHRLKQIVNNLLSNAFKFTDDGKISVKFALEKKMGEELLLSCHVTDTGMGIGEENQKQIFEKFTQIDTSLIRPFDGTGLGLAICRELTNLMGGNIYVKSELGKGSTFSFTFKAAFDQQEIDLPKSITKHDFKDLNLNILHVEDKMLNQKVVGFILFNVGCNVDFVKNGKEAVEYYFPGKYDIILMDIQMPVMDGISAYKELKRLYGDKLCPVIGVSANALEGDAEKYMEIGLDDYIVKPFAPRVLHEKLLKWAGKLNLQQ